MQNVFHSHESVSVIGSEWIEKLKSVAARSPMQRARLCLHASDDDPLHEMIIALAQDCVFRPHRHPSKSESFHMIQGRLCITIFADDGRVLRSFVLAPPGERELVCYRLSQPMFHAVLPLDPVVVYHEITNGPFTAGEAVVAEWAPEAPDELLRFLRAAAIEGGVPVEIPAALGV